MLGLGHFATLLPVQMMSLKPDCLPLGLLQTGVVTQKQDLAGSLVGWVLDETPEGFQNMEEVVLEDGLRLLHSQEACSHSKTLKFDKYMKLQLNDHGHYLLLHHLLLQ